MIVDKPYSFKFKTVLGIQPKIYVPIILLILTTVVFFTVINLLGLIFRKETEIVSWPSNAVVYIDGQKIGHTPLTYKIKRNSKLEVDKEGFRASVLNYNDKKSKLFFNLVSDNTPILENSYISGSNWSLISEQDISNRYRVPLIFSNDLSDALYARINEKQIDQYLESSLKHITNRYLLSDYLRGLVISKSDNKMLSTTSIIESVRFLDRVIKERESLPILIANAIMDISDNELYNQLTIRHKNIINRHVITFADKKRDIEIDDLTFKHVPASEIVPIDINYYHNIELDEFYILKNLLKKELYLEFIDENPQWSVSNLEELFEDNLVDKNYLQFNNDEEYITHISYFAAKAWCDWFNETNEIPDGYRLTLLEENMWYSVQHYNILPETEAWQWTNNGFYLYDHFLTDDSGTFIDEFTQTHTKVVVGKNRYNDKIESGRGIQRAEWCTPYLSFRPVLVPVKEM